MRLCATDNCTKHATGKSKYCPDHKKAARARWREMVRSQAEVRERRDEKFRAAFELADKNGKLAAEACVPTPMRVEQHASVLDDSSPVIKSWDVPDGVCGFASIVIRPGTCSAAHYAKKHHGARRAYYGGVAISVHGYGQSYERKMAYARAYAKALHAELGIDAHADGQLD